MTIDRGLIAKGSLLVIVLAGCGSSQAQESAADAGAESASARVVNVEVLPVASRPFTEQITVTGEVQADRDVTVSAEESGVIVEVLAQKGQRVAAGQPILRIEDRVLRGQYDQARSEAALAEETWERQRRLWEQDSIGSEIAYLRARYGAETADANARVLAARLERTTVRAPVAGILDDRFVEIGTMVAPGTPVGRVLDVDPLKVAAGVPERFAGDVRPGGTALVSFESGALGEVQGRVAFVGTALNAQNRTFPVEITLSNPSGLIKPGLVARVQLERGAGGEAILIPRDAVLRAEAGYIVYVVEDRGGETVAAARPVQLGAGQGRHVVIESGLSEGDRVVVLGQQQLAEGDRVSITGGSTGAER